MFKIDLVELRHIALTSLHGGSAIGMVRALCTEVSRQIRSDPRGASLPEDLGEALEVLLSSHKALAEAGEEMPTAQDVAQAWTNVSLQRVEGPEDKAVRVLDLLRPTVARLRRERDEARKVERVWRELQERAIPCGHKVEDLIGGAGQVTKCGACLAKKQAARCVDTTDIGITKPPPPPPPPAVPSARCGKDIDARFRGDIITLNCTRPMGHDGGCESC